jgi:hypothetical protein
VLGIPVVLFGLASWGLGRCDYGGNCLSVPAHILLSFGPPAAVFFLGWLLAKWMIKDGK